MLIREKFEEREEKFLSQYASKSKKSTRQAAEEKCSIRTEFQRDRDRIIHSKAFRRLKHKTQVFIAPKNDHFRTRLTHTLEVSQIARTIAKALNLNEDLTEAIALGHDLGHTPFGHIGERVLNDIKPPFKHYEQSLRVVDILENGGLNLTNEVRDGILNHSGNNVAFTLEGQIIKYADRIAYLNHDIEDAIGCGVLKLEDIPAEITKKLGNTSRQRINSLILSIVHNSGSKISMSEDSEETMHALRRFMFANVYNKPSEESFQEVKLIIEKLYSYYDGHKEEITLENANTADFIAAMSDNYAISIFCRIFQNSIKLDKLGIINDMEKLW